MSVPLDRLYNFLHDIVNHDITIYRFFPHGSKKLEDCSLLYVTDESGQNDQYSMFYLKTINMICHDQEPLDYDGIATVPIPQGPPNIPFSVFRWNVFPMYNLYDQNLLCHSERNSAQLTKFENSGSIGVYYWSHAIIARDWFRYAKFDSILTQKNYKQDFLIYNRAWTGTREYRLHFAESIVDAQLSHHCRMGFAPVDNDINYRNFKFKNAKLQINRFDLEDYFTQNTATSSSSADYVNIDYQETGLEVVLETLFDDERLHLTEKTLRPIACGQPFVMLGPCRSLEFLRSYGFKTFENYIDESYDLESDPILRMKLVIKLLKDISQKPIEQKLELFDNMGIIAEHNQTRFFSDDFMNQVVTEYQDNFNIAIDLVKKQCAGSFLKNMIRSVSDPLKVFNFSYSSSGQATQQDLDQLLNWIDQQNSSQS